MYNYLRTEGYYKMDPREKARTKFHFHRPGVDAFNTAKIGQGKNQKPQVTHVFTYSSPQGCGSGSILDPDSIGSVDPDPGGQK